MTLITWPSNTVEIIDDIRAAIGRMVTFYLVASSSLCPTCGIDPVTDTAIDPFCLTCSGLGYLYVYSGVSISGHVTWQPADIMQWTPGGQFYEGDVRVQIKNTPENVTVLDNTVYVDVDGKYMEIKKKTLRGVQQINRILIDLIEKEKDND